jgi:hypothetical protein
MAGVALTFLLFFRDGDTQRWEANISSRRLPCNTIVTAARGLNSACVACPGVPDSQTERGLR